MRLFLIYLNDVSIVVQLNADFSLLRSGIVVDSRILEQSGGSETLFVDEPDTFSLEEGFLTRQLLFGLGLESRKRRRKNLINIEILNTNFLSSRKKDFGLVVPILFFPDLIIK